MMAPSLETSSEATLPLIPRTPVHIVTKRILDVSRPVEVVESDSMSDAIASGSGNGASASATHSPVKAALTGLESTAAGFIVTPSRIQSRSHLPTAPVAPITPKQK